MIEIKYPYPYPLETRDGPLDYGQHVEDEIVASGVVVDVNLVQAIKIRTPRIHLMNQEQAVLELTLKGGATVEFPLHCPDLTIRHAHARICLHWVRRQIEHVREGEP